MPFLLKINPLNFILGLNFNQFKLFFNRISEEEDWIEEIDGLEQGIPGTPMDWRRRIDWRSRMEWRNRMDWRSRVD